ncbi:MAG: gliding motility-associated C-terminal domain-containing protein [Bacteroidetes bacterium]|nr:gliding motility-associated C-terminal domain-containing protein [Bacteroidota bacterium]
MSRTNTRDIRKSAKFLRHKPEEPTGALQLAPDGKIYVALPGQDHLGVIHAPDQAFPNYEDQGVRLVDNNTGESALSGLGLPTDLSFNWQAPPFYITYTCFGKPTLFYLTDTVGLTGNPYWTIYTAGSQIPIDAVESTGTFDAWYNFPDTGNFRVVMHANYSGEDLAHERMIKIHGIQAIDWVDTTLFCSGNDLVLDAGYGAFYEWDDTDERDRIRVVSEQEYLLQEYRVKVKDYHGCIAWDTIHVLKKFSPEIVRTETVKALCGAKNGSATVIPVGNIDDFEYFWEEDSTETSNTLSNIGGGQYHVHVINPKTSCARITEITVPELGGADVQIIGSADSIVCPGTPVTLTALNADAYEWINPPGATSEQITVTPFSDTVFTVRAFSQDDQGNECITFADFHLKVHPLSYPELGSDRTACSGDSIKLDIAGEFEHWNWNNGLSGPSQVFTESFQNLVLEVTDFNACITSDTLNVLFFAPPQLTSSSTKALCGELNGSATVIPDGITEEFLYIWEADPEEKSNTLTALGAGIYKVEVISLNTSCSSIIEILVEELGGPDTRILQPEDTLVCPGSPVILTAINAEDFEWIHPAGETNAEITVYPTDETNYIVRGISRDDEGHECSTYAEITIHVNTVFIPDLGPDLSACEGDTLLIDAGVGYDLYRWSNDSTSQSVQITSSHTPLIINVIDQNNCLQSDSVRIDFHPYPDVNLGEDQTICSNQPVILSGGIGDEYLWNNGSTDQEIEIIESGIFSIEITTSGCMSQDSVSVRLINPDHIIVDSISIKDVTCFGGNDAEIIIHAHGPGEMYAYSIFGNEEYQYNEGIFSQLSGGRSYSVWILEDSICAKEYSESIYLKDADSIFIEYQIKPPGCPECSDGIILLKEIEGGHPPFDIQWSDLGQGRERYNLPEGLYAVTITDSSQCKRTIPILLEQMFNIPNAFTPNGDGFNDSWKIPILRHYPNTKIWVYNKAGKMIYESAKGYPVPWNGIVSGVSLPMGTYYYVIIYDELAKPISGDLTIIR